MVDLSNIYNRPPAFDISAALNFINARKEMALRAEELEFRRQQAHANRQIDEASQALEIQERTVRIALHEEALRDAPSIREGRLLDIEAKKDDILRERKKEELLNKQLNVYNGVAQALGDTPSPQSVFDILGNLGKLSTYGASQLPGGSRNPANVQGAEAGISGVIAGAGEAIMERRDADSFDFAKGIIGIGQYAERYKTIAPLLQDKAFKAIDQSLQATRSSISSIPSPDYVSKMAMGLPDEMIAGYDAVINEAVQHRDQILDPIYEHPQFSGDANAALTQANEKILELVNERETITAGKSVLDNGVAANLTPMHAEGVRKIIGQRVNKVLWKVNPGVAVMELGETMRKANFIPVKEVAPIIDAAMTADPVSQVKAAMVVERLQTEMPTKIGDLAKELESRGSWDSIQTMIDIRKGMGQIEVGFMAMDAQGGDSPESIANFAEYAAQLSDATERSMVSRSEEEASSTLAKGIGAGGGLDKKAIAQFASVEKYIGANKFWNGSGVLDELDLSPEEGVAVDGGTMYEEFSREMSRSKVHGNHAARFATSQILDRYHKGSLFGDHKATANHPLNIAKDKYGREDMDPEFAIDLARYQIQKDLDTVLTKDGEPARIRVDDVDGNPVLLTDGSLAWEIRLKEEQEMLGIKVEDTIAPEVQEMLRMSQAKRFVPFVYQPDYSNDAMLEVLGNRVDDSLAGVKRPAGFYDNIEVYLGTESPAHKAKVARDIERVQDARRGELERQQFFGGERERLLNAIPGSKKRTPPPKPE